ncbi:hypothetical protein [Staphylospora marina]|uniref:hypothetical protein n=1 Tax=Staphylospora marina TaxID=2490858 RepID=UPI000F5BBA09|nr:hypothetical protein [Staphylospora marina]
MNARFKRTLLRWLSMTLVPFALYGCGMGGYQGSSGSSGTAEETGAVIRPDVEFSPDLGDMIRKADLIVIGAYKKLEKAGNTLNPKASSTEHLVYTFEVERVLKGTADPTIQVDLLWKISPEGVRDKNGKPVPLKLEHPWFRSPELGERTILFLDKAPNEQAWTKATEPFEIGITHDGKAELRSTILTGKARKTVMLNQFSLTIDYSVNNYRDTVSGRPAEEIIREIEQAVKENKT